MLARAHVRALAAAQLRARFDAQVVAVRVNRALSDAPEHLPALTITTPHEKKDAETGRNVPFFRTHVTLQIVARVIADTDDLATLALEDILAGIEESLLASQAMLDVVSQFPSVESTVKVDATGGRVVADLTMHIVCEVMEIFDPTRPMPMQQIAGFWGRPGDLVGADGLPSAEGALIRALVETEPRHPLSPSA